MSPVINPARSAGAFPAPSDGGDISLARIILLGAVCIVRPTRETIEKRRMAKMTLATGPATRMTIRFQGDAP